MSAGATSSSSGGSTIKNILVGVITTVLGSAAIYWFGIHDTDNFKPRQEANIRAWNSLIQYEVFYTNSIDKISCIADTVTAYQDFAREMDQTVSNMMNIKSEALVDNKLMSLIDRRVQTIKDVKATMLAYRDKIAALTGTDALAAQEAEETKFTAAMESLGKRDNDFINEIVPQLEKDYKTTLKRPEFSTLDVAAISGNWKMDAEIELTIKKEGQFTWKKADSTYAGNWLLNDRDISFFFSDGEKINYVVKKISSSAAILQNTDNKKYSNLCRE